MKVIVLAGITPSTFFAHVSLATALRDAGHQVMVTAAADDVVPAITAAGLAAVPVLPPGLTRERVTAETGLFPPPPDALERERWAGGLFAAIESRPLEALVEFGESWRPDIVIGGMLAYGAPLLAARLDVPYVRQAWDIHDPELFDAGAESQLREQLERLGLTGLPEPDLLIEVEPPSLRQPGGRPGQMMRWIPGNAQCRLEPWMYTKGAATRVGITVGTAVADYDQYDFVQGIVENVAALDVETAVAVPGEAVPTLRERMDGTGVHLGWIPLDVLAPTCDVLVHQSGGSTMMTALSFGVPQVLLPDAGQFRQVDMARRLVEAGAALTLSHEQATTEAIAEKCQEIISDPGYAAAAAGLAAEIAALPLPSEVVRRIEGLVRRASA
ncbi:glycosyltransferase [Amycolatopsis sp. PS_44_ISF1]|uniref:glycosyltransferase n=1 Tax=Amycolatopsis sp. PS_44_ISF1 TaxID=2974917 RepID=UPI0028DFCAD3|nr:glycosyltransferase [Amycolatopsis sp. PS_44_ISF1]MDT8909765.1 glycosyltransferase [Amycolatopsis sp. PS_44_ISF1]